MNAKTKKKTVSLIALITLSFLFFLLGFYSLAWFIDTFRSGEVGFNAGAPDGNLLEIAKIIHSEDATEEPKEDMREYFVCDNMHIEYGSLPTQNGNEYIVTLDQMSFGFIDNVALLKPDNVVYFRLSVPKKNGNTVKLKLYYNVDAEGNFVDIYKSIYDIDGETVLHQEKVLATDALEDGTTTIIDAFQNVETEDGGNDCFLRFSVCLSNQSYEAHELSDLEFYGKDGAVADGEADTYYRFNEFDGDSESVTLVNEKIASADESYYVYVRVEPNLSVFGHSIEYISSIMPCYVYFKVNAAFEICGGE